ncbi:hypothetical protein BH11BAC6_BH11BAC6_14510 [soil metagenome]
MYTEFKTGDCVRLKHTDLQMMVKAIAGNTPAHVTADCRSYECVWYENAMLQMAVFTEDVLDWLAPYHDVLHFANYE